MKTVFEGLQGAIDFAQSESIKQRKKLSIFLTRDNGVQYVVADDDSKPTVKGKFLSEHGKNMPLPTSLPPKQEEKKPDPVVVQEPVKKEEPEPKEGEEVKEEEPPVVETTEPSKPKKATKEDDGK